MFFFFRRVFIIEILCIFASFFKVVKIMVKGKTFKKKSESGLSKPLVVMKSTLGRLPVYYCYIQERMKEGLEYVSSSAMAESLSLNPVLVRKDLASVSTSPGRPKLGFRTAQLLQDMKSYLGYDNYNEAVLVGVGGLGKTLLQYPGFKNYGLDVVAGFDVDDKVVGQSVGGKPVYHVSKLERFVRRLGVKLGIIAVPGPQAQGVADLLVVSGIKGIWNFAPAHIALPSDVAIRNENLAASLAALSKLVSKE